MNISHPLTFLPAASRKRIFWVFFILTLGVMAVFQFILDPPLRTAAAPNGIVSFELAGTPENAQAMLDSWDATARLYNAFGLGFDFLFMPIYATAIAISVLMASTRRGKGFAVAGAWIGWLSYLAILFDGIENINLFKILLQGAYSPNPEIAAICATIKFALIFLGIFYALIGWIFKK